MIIKGISYHRNGISGNGFHVVLFESGGRNMLGVVFEEPGNCAVLDIDLASKGDVAFGSNSWRGDVFEKELREFVAAK